MEEHTIYIANDKLPAGDIEAGDLIWSRNTPNESFTNFIRSKTVPEFGVNTLSDFAPGEVASPLAYWRLFIDKTMIDLLVQKYSVHLSSMTYRYIFQNCQIYEHAWSVKTRRKMESN